MNLYQWFKGLFESNTKTKIKYSLRTLIGYFIFFDLNRLALIHKTDKFMVNGHAYTPIYAKHLRSFKWRKNTILEIGIGGYGNESSGGHSLRMWKNYFPFSSIYGIDIYDKSFHDEFRIKTFQGSQVDSKFLTEVVNFTGNPNIIIDDGSHMNEHVIETFKLLFPELADDGIYVIEDTQTSYWGHMGGSSKEMNSIKTTMGFFKSLADGLNHAEFIIPEYQPTYYDLNIKSIHFYHNMIFIYKGLNNQKSNVLANNEYPNPKLC